MRDEALTVLCSLIESFLMHPRGGSFTIELVGEMRKKPARHLAFPASLL